MTRDEAMALMVALRGDGWTASIIGGDGHCDVVVSGRYAAAREPEGAPGETQVQRMLREITAMPSPHRRALYANLPLVADRAALPAARGTTGLSARSAGPGEELIREVDALTKTVGKLADALGAGAAEPTETVPVWRVSAWLRSWRCNLPDEAVVRLQAILARASAVPPPAPPEPDARSPT